MCCGSTKSLAYQSLQLVDSEASGIAAVQAETCDDCDGYLKIMHTDRDPFVEPIADDLATLTLDFLLAESGKHRFGRNLMLLFGAEEEQPKPTQPHRSS
jgi:FdhE protein